MFPIADSIRYRRFPFITLLLIAINFLIFLLQLLSPNEDAFINRYALIPSHVHIAELSTLYPFITAIFLHGGWLHILSNMWFLWVFGNSVEAGMSRLQYILLYMIAGIIGNITEMILVLGSSIPMLGASGAIAGVLGAYFIMFPYAKVKTLIFFFFVTIVSVSAPLILGYWFLLQLFLGSFSLLLEGTSGGVAFGAHVGGFIFGVAFASLFVGVRRIKKLI